MNKLLIIATLIWLSGCAPWETIEYPLDFWLDEDASEETKVATLDAVKDWNALSREKLGYSVFTYKGERSVNVNSAMRDSKFDVLDATEEEDADLREEYNPDYLGLCFLTHGREARVDIIMANPEMMHRFAYGYDLRHSYHSVVLHELGHALGLSHTSVPGDTMYAYSDPLDEKVEITDLTVSEFCRLHGCE